MIILENQRLLNPKKKNSKLSEMTLDLDSLKSNHRKSKLERANIISRFHHREKKTKKKRENVDRYLGQSHRARICETEYE